MAETCYEYFTDDKLAVISTNEKRIVNQVLRLADERPGDVVIQFMPEKNGGVLVAKVPRSWIKKPSPPRAVSDEQRARMSEQFKNRVRNQSPHGEFQSGSGEEDEGE